MEIINKKILRHLAELSKIELIEDGEEKLLDDLRKILEYFEELKKIDTIDIEPIAGGADLINIYREDRELLDELYKKQEKLIEAFPERGGDFLKVPPVFQ
ncbi:MAG: Asp-tRNA(Asn)/Glu-tRNA(Gln) amidotransferase subunit GatC [Patescibacteria group bacterium]